MSTLRLHLLGTFELFTADGAPAAPLPKKARALLAFVALARGRAVPREQLATLLWADTAEEQARASLRQALTAIRRAAPAVEADTETVLLAPSVSSVDVWDLEGFAAKSGDDEALERALDVYRGELLAGLRVDAPEFDDWRSAEAERLRGVAANAGTVLVRRLNDRGEFARAAESAARLLAMEPLREDIHRHLMQLYVRLGRPADALRQYRRCRTLLAQELGVQPDPETEALHRSIVEQRRQPGTPSGGTAAAPLGMPAEPIEPPRAEPTEVSSGAREAVVVIADLAGFTAYAASQDVESVHEFLVRYRDGVRRVVRDAGGLLTNFIGARVMMVFGAPVAHGNDASRALRAALALGTELDRARPSGDVSLAVKAGVASGRVIASREEGQVTVTGAPVSLAARIMEQTPSGEVWVADPVVQAMGERVEAEPLTDMGIAVLGGPLQLWRVRGIGHVSRARAIAFTGRSTEVRTAAAALSRVIDRRNGHLLLIEGEAGIGKSRLLAHLLQQASARGFAVHLARTLDFGGVAAEPMRALISDILGVPAGGDAILRARRLEEGVERLVLTPSLHAPLGDMLDLPPRGRDAAMWDAMDDTARDRARQLAVIRAVAAAARQRPIVLAVDDLHWAEAGTRRTLEAVARGTRDQPVLLVICTRPSAEHPATRWGELMGDEAHTVLRLQPLAPEEALRLAWGYGVDDVEFLQDCVERAQGHPLFLDQLLRYGARGDAVPGSIQNVVLARLDSLPADERRALQAAAVLGQRFTGAALCVLLNDPEYRPDSLIAQSLLREDPEGYAFTHALIQEAVAASLLRDARVSLHLRAAEHFAGRDGALAAEHLAAAGDAGAARAFLEAAKREAARNHMERALRLAQRGLECSPDETLRVDLLCLSADAMADSGSVRESVEHYRSALALARTDAARCRCLLGLAAALRVLDRQLEALEVLAEAEPLAARMEDVRTQAQVHILRGSACFPIGRFDDCLNAYDRALKLAERAGAADLQARALGGLGDAHYQRGRLQTAHRMFTDCVALARERRLVRVEVSNLPMLALTHLARAEVSAARTLAEQAKSIARSLGDRRADALADVALAEIHVLAGQWNEALDTAERAISLSRRMGSRRFEADGLMFKAICLHAHGHDAAALPLLERAWEIAQATSVNYFGPTILVCMAQVTADPERRAWALAEGERLLAGDCVSHCYFHFYKIGIEIAIDSGDAALARRYAGLLEEYASREPLPLIDLVVHEGRMLARHVDGERSPELSAELQALRTKAAAAGLDSFLPRLDGAATVQASAMPAGAGATAST
ncbi:MAG: AAA family ATPase [Burkholderiales bacterium]|nr:AAA family ATPase [Burkholderiales bacterium]